MQMITPVFQVQDYQQAHDFYVSWLGFRLDWEDRASDGKLYMQVSRGGFTLHLSNNRRDSSPGAKVRAGMNGLIAYHHILLKKENPFPRPDLVKANWNERVMQAEVVDPFGNRIIFEEVCA